MTVCMFDALRIVLTFGSRSSTAAIGAVVVMAVLVVVSIPFVERANRTLAIGLVVTIGLARVAAQLMPAAPSLAGQILPAALIVGLFGGAVATHASVHGGRTVGLGVLLGSAFDVAFLSGSATLPSPWVQGVTPVVGVVLAMLVAVGALGVEQRLTMPSRSGARVPAVSIVALGAWVGLHLMLFSNLGWIRSISGGEPWMTVLPGALGIAGAAVWLMQGRRESQPVVAAGIATSAAVLLTAADSVWAIALMVVIAGGAGVALTGMLERNSSAAPERLQWATGTVAVLALAPTVIKEANEAASGITATISAVLLLLLCSVFSMQHNSMRAGAAHVPALIALGLLGAALAGSSLAQTMGHPETPGELLVATYDIDRGFLPDGDFDPYAGAQVMLDLGADVVALPDITRGRVSEGITDLAQFLTRRTGTTIEWFGGEDGYGSAVELSVEGVAASDLGVAGLLRVIEVLPELEDDGQAQDDAVIRLLAVDATGSPVTQTDVGGVLLDLWDRSPHTVFAGSFEEGAETEPIATLVNAGLFDVTLAMQEINPLTFPADLPTMQLDYILISPDLRPTGARIGDVSSSTHLPVISRVVIRSEQ